MDRLPTGYIVQAVWVKDHWVFKVFLEDAWMDSFLDLNDVLPAIAEYERN